MGKSIRNTLFWMETQWDWTVYRNGLCANTTQPMLTFDLFFERVLHSTVNLTVILGSNHWLLEFSADIWMSSSCLRCGTRTGKVITTNILVASCGLWTFGFHKVKLGLEHKVISQDFSGSKGLGWVTFGVIIVMGRTGDAVGRAAASQQEGPVWRFHVFMGLRQDL